MTQETAVAPTPPGPENPTPGEQLTPTPPPTPEQPAEDDSGATEEAGREETPIESEGEDTSGEAAATEETEQPPQPAWATVLEPDKVYELEDFQPLRQKDKDEGYQAGYGKAHSTMQERQNQEVQKIVAGAVVQEVAKALDRVIKTRGQEGMEEVGEWMDGHPEFADIFRSNLYETGQQEAAKDMGGQLVGYVKHGLDAKGQATVDAEIARLRIRLDTQQIDVHTYWQGLLSVRDKAVIAKAKPALEKEIRFNIERELNQKQRQGQGRPPGAPTGVGASPSGRPTPAEYAAASAAQRAEWRTKGIEPQV